MRTLRFAAAAACPLAVIALSTAVLAQPQARPVQPKPRITQPRNGTRMPNAGLPAIPRAAPRAGGLNQYPMPIARVDTSRFNMPIIAGDPARYPIRVIRPEGEVATRETAPPRGVPVDPKLLEPVRLQITPAQPPVSK